MIEKIEKFFTPLADRIGRNKYLRAIRDGFMLTMPLLIAGSIFLIIANFPIKGWEEFWAKFFGEGWTSYLSKPTDATFSLMALLALVGIAASFSEQMGVDKLYGVGFSMASFFLLMPYEIEHQGEMVKGVPLQWLGSNGIFIGIITVFLSIHIFSWVEKRGWTIKMPAGVPPTVVESFSALIPGIVTLTVFFAIYLLFLATPYGDAFSFVYDILQRPLLRLGNTLGAMVVAYIFLHFFWFFGINGGSVVGSVFNPILESLSAENLAQTQQGLQATNIINKQFQDLFATFGGAGSTLSLVIAVVLICKSKRLKELGKLSIVPGIFGINEPIIFGMPIVLNPIMLIPFMLVPTINIVISYFAMKWGWVPIASGVAIPWTMPPVISGFLSCGWQGSVLQIVLIIFGIFIYMPFVKMLDKQYLNEEKEEALKETEEIDLDNFSFED